MYEYLQDKAFLKQLDKQQLRTYYIKVILLDWEEHPIQDITGRITAGNINIDGNSSVQRTANITFIPEDENIEHILSLNTKVKIFVGIENNIDLVKYNKIIWFPQGIFIITQLNINNSSSGLSVQLNLKDKMCLLNGEVAGTLPASVTFHEYDQNYGYYHNGDKVELSSIDMYQLNEYNFYFDGEKYYKWNEVDGFIEIDKINIDSLIKKGPIQIKNRIYDILLTLVQFYGHEPRNKIIIQDVPLQLKNALRYVGKKPLYLNSENQEFTYKEPEEDSKYIEYEYNDDVGYTYTDFTYPGELISGFGENICNVLDKIKTTLGNFEYFYDIEGNFIFREKKNFLNTQYNPVINNNGFIIIDLEHNSKSIYNFNEDSPLITSYSNNPNYMNIKNDFHIWGNKDNLPIHYHAIIKHKPNISNWKVHYNEKGIIDEAYQITKEWIEDTKDIRFDNNTLIINDNDFIFDNNILKILDKKYAYFNNNIIFIKTKDDYFSNYTPADWRVQIYLEGLQNKQSGNRPTMLQQEILDYFSTPGYYDFKNKKYMASKPNDLIYFIDFIEPQGQLEKYDVDKIDIRTLTKQEDRIKKIYSKPVLDAILINTGLTEKTIELIQNTAKKRKNNREDAFINVRPEIYKNFAMGTYGYSAEGVMRDNIYLSTCFAETISLSSLPIYYLEPNSRITVNDDKSNIKGDYIINSISIPLDGKNTMTISASRVFERI